MHEDRTRNQTFGPVGAPRTVDPEEVVRLRKEGNGGKPMPARLVGEMLGVSTRRIQQICAAWKARQGPKNEDPAATTVGA